MVHLAAVLLLSAVASANLFAEPISPNIEKRTTVATGGWPLYRVNCAGSNMVGCPGTAYGCCPSGNTCVAVANSAIGYVCCPTGADCSAALIANPVCADDTWGLWSVTTQPKGQGYFCCTSDQIGTNKPSCNFKDGILTSSLAASQIFIGSTSAVQTSAPKTVAPSLTNNFLSATTSVTSTSSKADAGDLKAMGYSAFGGIAALEFIFGLLL